ncbi:protein RRP5 homolog isoform X2 [Varroa jacobsoni]|nr:protein RRP5 homolog isoform X3 [Varroa destructor]XP_022667154.1 protein RRP5 homolog isoform X3 [Varroa destructor]XP_022667155.1 protein RRP5 homolog isoform X3 [Varroa destructor]XP_022701535.1 protein RRP5 homolog isoform X2 [Varroa jacobsoni]
MSGAAGEEQYFPRGHTVLAVSDKKDSKAKRALKKAEKRRQSEDFFRIINASKKAKRAKKSSAKLDEHETRAADDDPMQDIVIEPLTQKTVQTGMVILGAVHHIYGSMLRVALPGTVAHLPLANVSASYSSLAERWACIPQKKNQRRTLADPSLPEKLLTLDELFKIGQVLKFAVQMTSSDSPPIVSTIPEDVNGGLSQEKLREGMVLQVAVSSVEDHGYALETGISGLTGAFLAAKQAPRVLHIGELLLVRVEKKGLAGRLKFEPYTFGQVIETGEEWNLNTIMPGMVTDATIVQSDASGLGLWLLNNELIGAVEPRQIPRDASLSGQLTLQSHVSAVVLYKHPILNTLYCSLRVPPISELNPFDDFHGVRLGQIIEKAIVVDVQSTFVKLEVPLKKKHQTSLIAIATKENVFDDDGKEPQDVFSPGQVTSCRVIGLSLLERELYVSLRESVVDSGCYYTEDELIIGKTLPAKVKYSNDTGIVFDICPGVTAFCDFVEASFVVNKNNVAELFPPGKPVQIRIRYINGKHYPKRYFVTCNRQLVKSKHELVCSYETCHVGKISDGVVLMVKPRGLLVGFYNKVRGWVPEEYLPHSYARADEIFKVGQVVTAKIVNINPDAERMTLSLQVNVGDDNNINCAASGSGKNVGANKQSQSDKKEEVEFLTDIEATVIKKDRHCLELDADELGPCLLSREHLSDFSDISRALFTAISPGNKLNKLTCIGSVGGKKQLSIKPFIRSMVISGQLHNGPLKPGAVLPAMIRSAGSWGAVLSLPNSHSAKVMLRDLADSYIPKDHTCLAEGATLICKVMSVGAAEDTIGVSCKRSEINYALDASYKESLATSLRTLLSYGGEDSIGQVIKVTPKKVSYNIICDYKGQRAIACRALTTDGQGVRVEPTNAIVLGYRFQDGRRDYIVTIDRDVVYKYLQVTRRFKKGKSSQGKGTIHCKAEVLVLAVLRDYAAAFTKDGRLLMLTLGNHPNDVRRGHWTIDREDQRLPRVVEAYLYDTLAPVNDSILVGNFCRVEGVATVDMHVIQRLGEEVELIDDFASGDSSNENEFGHTLDMTGRSLTMIRGAGIGQGGGDQIAEVAGGSRRGNQTTTDSNDNSSSNLSTSDYDEEGDLDEDGISNDSESSVTKFDSEESGTSDSEFQSDDSDD